jgi:hypothetical protein
MLSYWGVRYGESWRAAGGTSRAEGDAHQRVERVGGRCLPVLLPRGESRADRRYPHVGRTHRDQRSAGARGRRRPNGADVPDVRRTRPVVRRGPRRRPRHRGGRGSVCNSPGHRSTARARDSKSCPA